MARPKSDIQPRIVQAAKVRFIHEGVDGASLRQIAKEAATSLGMIYYYYPTKDDLFLAVVEQVYSELLNDLALALAPDVPVRERLLRLYVRLGQVSEGELSVVRLVVREALGSSERLQRLLERFKRGHIPLVIQTLKEGQAAGVIRDDLPLLQLMLATMALGTFPQFVRALAGRHLPFDNGQDSMEFSAGLLDILFRGVGAPS